MSQSVGEPIVNVIYDEKYLQELRARNEVRLKEAKEKLGVKWLLHPDNKKTRVRTKKPTLKK
jgi:hypothetical protein